MTKPKLTSLAARPELHQLVRLASALRRCSMLDYLDLVIAPAIRADIAAHMVAAPQPLPDSQA